MRLDTLDEKWTPEYFQKHMGAYVRYDGYERIKGVKYNGDTNNCYEYYYTTDGKLARQSLTKKQKP